MTPRFRSTVAGLAFGLVVSTSWAADEPVPDPRREGLEASERVAALVARVKQEQAAVESLRADFVQRKESLVFAEPQVAEGSFVFGRPDRVRWVYETPDRMQIVIGPDEMVTWYESLGTAERLAVGSVTERIVEYLGASNSLDLLERYFDVAVAFPDDRAEPYRLELSPRFERVAKRIAAMTIWIDPELFLPSGLRYEEPDGDVTEYRFAEVELNVDLPADSFELSLPADVEVRSVELGPDR